MPYRPLGQEISDTLDLASLRWGNSPRVCSFKLLDECNFDCAHCDANKVSGKRLSLGGVVNVLHNLKQLGIQTVDFTGGEPTLRKDLVSIVAYAAKLGLRPTLNTNGGIEREEEHKYWKNMAEAGLRAVHFAYDGMPPKNDQRVIALAHYALETLHIYGGVRTVVTMDNLDKVYNIGELCLMNSIFFQPVSDPTTAWHCESPSAHWISVDARGNARVCNDVTLPKTYSLTGKENPLLTEEFHNAVTEASEKCAGCSWLCHWIGGRKQILRTKDEWRLYLTAASLT